MFRHERLRERIDQKLKAEKLRQKSFSFNEIAEMKMDFKNGQKKVGMKFGKIMNKSIFRYKPVAISIDKEKY